MESFREWRMRFDEERKRAKESSGKGKESSQTTARLTGRDHWHSAVLMQAA